MEVEEYRCLARRESFCFWNIGRREILREALLRYITPSPNREILDIGCGPGGNIAVLKEFGRVTGLDVSDEALHLAERYDFIKLIQSGAEEIPLESNSFDFVSSLDVLEHVADDEKVMREAYRLMKPGGTLLVAVPAHPWLWSRHDEALRHYRRYTTGGLVAKLEKAGFLIQERSHFVMLAVPVNLLHKVYDLLFSRKRAAELPQPYNAEFSAALNSFLLLVLRGEKFLMRFISLPIGSSLCAIAVKPEDGSF